MNVLLVAHDGSGDICNHHTEQDLSVTYRSATDKRKVSYSGLNYMPGHGSVTLNQNEKTKH